MGKPILKMRYSEEDKFLMRMNMTHEERFRAFMKVSRFKAKLKSAKIIKAD
jgi:hypothetical protein